MVPVSPQVKTVVLGLDGSGTWGISEIIQLEWLCVTLCGQTPVTHSISSSICHPHPITSQPIHFTLAGFYYLWTFAQALPSFWDILSTSLALAHSYHFLGLSSLLCVPDVTGHTDGILCEACAASALGVITAQPPGPAPAFGKAGLLASE